MNINRNYYSKLRQKLPPFGRHALENPSSIHQSIIFTGKDAWQGIKNPNFYPTSTKLLLPFQDDPQMYLWPVSGNDVLLFSRGKAESKERLFSLSMALMKNGASLVLWATNEYSFIKIDKKVKAAA